MIKVGAKFPKLSVTHQILKAKRCLRLKTQSYTIRMVGCKMSETAVVMILVGLFKPTLGGARLPYL